MATLKLSTDDFSDIVLAFLMDKVINPEKVMPDNERLNSLVEKTGSLMRQNLISSYLDMDVQQRMKYKKINKIFRGGDQSHRIVIEPSEKEEEEKPKKKDSILKKVIKKIMDDSSYDLQEKEILKEHIFLMEEEDNE